MPDLATGYTFGVYRIRKKIQQGGMAAIYQADDTRYRRLVAIKTLLTDRQVEEEFVRRFHHEARSAAALQHPNILPVYDSGTLDNGQPYLVMAWADGGSLADQLARRGGPLPLGQVARLAAQVASALDYAHEQGTVHRDVKPSNILLKGGQAMLSDFGVAKAAQDSRLTVKGTQLGTPLYMAPEQVRGEPAGPAADIYALGVMLYEMLTGQPPFQGQLASILHHHVYEAPPPLRSRNPSLPAALEPVIGRAMAKGPQQRYPTAGALAADLQAALGRSSGALVSPFGGRLPLAALGGGLAVLLTLALATALAAMLSGHWKMALGTTPTPGLGATDTPTPLAPVTATPVRSTPTPPPPFGPAASRPNLTDPAEGQTFAAGSRVTVQWSGPALAAGERFRVAVRDEAGATLANAEAEALQYVLSDLPAGRYVWLVTRERQEGDRWTEIARSAAQAFVIQPPPSPTPPPTSTATPQPPPTAPTVAEITVAPATTVAPPPAAAPGLGGKLAFSLPQGTGYKVYVVEVGPTPPASLYASLSQERQPALSYDGKWLLANGTGQGMDALIRLTSDGQQPTAMTCAASTAESGRPVWSPDGRLMAFDGLAADVNNPQIYIQTVGAADCDLGGKRFRVNGGMVTDPNGLYPLWGPDGRIYFRSCATWDTREASKCGIWSARPDGGDVRQLTDSSAHLPTSVSGDHLLYMSAQSGNWEVYSVGLQGGAPGNVTNQAASDVWGTFSPDGRNMAFLSNRDGGWAIWLANADGSAARRWLSINPDWGEVDPSRMTQERMSWSQ